MSTQLFDLRKEKQDLLAKAEEITNRCELANKRPLTAQERTEFETAMDRVQVITPIIREKESQNTLAQQFRGKVPVFEGDREPTWKSTRKSTPNGGMQFADLAKFIGGEVGEEGVTIRASLTDGGDLQHVIPGHIVDRFRTAYPQTDPYRQAGASITDLDLGWIDGVVPIFAAGTDPSVYSEGSGPTSDESAKVYALELKTPKKIAFLSLPSEEAVADVDALAATIGRESIVRLLNGRTKRVTQDFMTALASAGATVTSSGDNYKDILDLIGKIPPAFSSNNLVFMMSRKTRSRLLNTRATGTDAPIFSPDLSRCLGVPVIINDFVTDQKVLHGDFSTGVFIRSSAVFVQRMEEAYRSVGAIGFRSYHRSDWGFFASAANATLVENPVYMLTALDFGC